MYLKVRVTLRNNEDGAAGHGFGRGIELLLGGVEKYGSLNRAAKEMGMAYSKAWRIIRLAEAEFRTPLLDRDGPRGSKITQEGRALFGRYLEMQKAAQEAADKIFVKYYGAGEG